MKKPNFEDQELLAQYGISDSRRTLLKSMLLMGVSASALTPFAKVLAAATEQEVKKLAVLSQPGALPSLCHEISSAAIKQRYPNVEIEVVDSNNATSYPRMLAQRNRPVISGA